MMNKDYNNHINPQAPRSPPRRPESTDVHSRLYSSSYPSSSLSSESYPAFSPHLAHIQQPNLSPRHAQLLLLQRSNQPSRPSTQPRLTIRPPTGMTYDQPTTTSTPASTAVPHASAPATPWSTTLTPSSRSSVDFGGTTPLFHPSPVRFDPRRHPDHPLSFGMPQPAQTPPAPSSSPPRPSNRVSQSSSATLASNEWQASTDAGPSSHAVASSTASRRPQSTYTFVPHVFDSTSHPAPSLSEHASGIRRRRRVTRGSAAANDSATSSVVTESSSSGLEESHDGQGGSSSSRLDDLEDARARCKCPGLSRFRWRHWKESCRYNPDSLANRKVITECEYCGKPFAGSRPENLKRHYKTCKRYPGSDA